MNDRSPFRVMCNLCGVDTAIKKCREMGVSVTEEEIETEREKIGKLMETLSAFVRSCVESKEGPERKRE